MLTFMLYGLNQRLTWNGNDDTIWIWNEKKSLNHPGLCLKSAWFITSQQYWMQLHKLCLNPVISHHSSMYLHILLSFSQHEHWLLSCIIFLNRNRCATILTTLLDVLHATEGFTCLFSATFCGWIVNLWTPLLSSSGANKKHCKFMWTCLWKLHKQTTVLWLDFVTLRRGEQMLLFILSILSMSESQIHNPANSLCARPQLHSCSRTITLDQNNKHIYAHLPGVYRGVRETAIMSKTSVTMFFKRPLKLWSVL